MTGARWRGGVLLAASVFLVAAGPMRAEEPAKGKDQAVGTARRFLAHVQAGQGDAAFAMLTPGVQKQITAAQLAAVWGQMEQQFGTAQPLGKAEIRQSGGRWIVDYPGRWGNTDLTVRVVVSHNGRVAGFWIRPASKKASKAEEPPYAEPAAFVEREVRLGPAESSLPAILTLPRDRTGVPGVVLVHGSGPHDADESIGPNRPFRDLAHGLACRGIASLRYEKRTRVYPEQFAGEGMTVAREVLDDAVAALALLRQQSEVDPARVFVLGHSLGATLAPEIAARDGQVAGVIMLAPAARPIVDLIVVQLEYLASIGAGGVDAAGVEAMREAVAQFHRGELGPDDTLGAFGPVRYWQDLSRYDGINAQRRAAALKVPILILRGERDYQIPAEEITQWRQALAGREGVTIREMPGLNHIFMMGSGPSRPGEYQRAGHVAEEVINAVADWIIGTPPSGRDGEGGGEGVPGRQ